MSGMMLFKKNIEIKKIVLILALSIISAGALVFYFGGLSNRQFEKTMDAVNQEHMLDIVRAEVVHIEHELNNIQLEIELLASNPTIRERIRTNVKMSEIPEEAYNPISIVIRHWDDLVDSLYRIDSKGIVQERTPFKEGKEGNDYSNKPGVKNVIENHVPYISELFVTNSGFKAISVCVPVFDDAVFTGVLRAVIYMDSINDGISRIKIGEKGYAWIMDDNGILLYHPKNEQIGKDIMSVRKKQFPDMDWSDLENIVNKMKAGEEGTGIYYSAWWTEEDPEIVKKLAAFTSLKIGHKLWSMGLSMGYYEIEEPVKKHARNTIELFGVTMLFLILAAFVIYKIQKKKTELEITARSAEELKSANLALQAEMREHKLTGDAFADERNMLRTLIDNLPDHIFIKDAKSKFVTCNIEVAKFLGVDKPDELISRTDFDFIPREIAEKFYNDEQEIMRTGVPMINEEEISVHSSGQTRWFFTTKVPLRESNGNITGIVGISRDITEKKHLEEQLQIRQRMDSIGTLGAGIAHDFNNLLAGIMGYLDILLNINNKGLSETQKEYISNALKSCHRAADLVKQFQSLSKGTVSSKTSVDLYEASIEVFSLLEKTTDKLILKEADLEPGEFYVTADPSELNQVLLNLGTNAVKAIEEKGIKPGDHIRIRAREYTITGKDKTGLVESKYIHIFFEDTGIGMTDDVKRQAFDPLFTTRGKSSQKGQGLGLAMVFNIITRRHDGYIDIESAEGEGTTIHIYLPKAQSRQQIKDREVKRVAGGNETILIIEDEETVLNLAKEVLGNYGYNILTAFDGRQGLDIYAKHKDSIDLVLLDLMMPEMSGRMVFKEMLQINPAVKVIISSGQSEEDTSQGIFSKAKASVSKPYKVSELAQTVRTVLDL